MKPIRQFFHFRYNTNVPSDAVTTYCTCAQSGPVDTYQFVLPNTAHCNMTSPSQLCKEDNTVLTLTSCLHSEKRRKRFTGDTDDVKMESELTYDPDYNESAIIEVRVEENVIEKTLFKYWSV